MLVDLRLPKKQQLWTNRSITIQPPLSMRKKLLNGKHQIATPKENERYQKEEKGSCWYYDRSDLKRKLLTYNIKHFPYTFLRTTMILNTFRVIWTMLNENLCQSYKPSEWITIDEQLYGYRGRIRFPHYRKLEKYSIKIF